MDKPRTGHAEKRRLKRTILFAAIAIVVVLVSVGISRLQPAAPQADRETLFFGKVQRGVMSLDVRGPGTLVPVDVRWVSAPVEGRVERVPALPGVAVSPETVLVELSNPEIEQNAFEAESNLRAGEAELDNLRAQLESQLLGQQAQVATAESNSESADLQAEADQKLYGDALIPELTLKLSRLRSDQLKKQRRIEKERYVKSERSNQAQMAAQRARVDQLRALYELRRRQVEFLKVRAGIPGVLQELPVQVGQRVTPGTTLARVARPELLKAELRIQETQAKDVVSGQKATIDTRVTNAGNTGLVAGTVIRVAPSSQEGSVIVDVSFDGPLPPGARPNLSVDGTIQLDRLNNVLFMNRPSFAQNNGKIEIFKVVEGGKAAVRVPVQLGRASVSTVQVVSGLQIGDEVILSDTSNYDGFNRIRLN
jgi:HlyD family secretion protein